MLPSQRPLHKSPKLPQHLGTLGSLLPGCWRKGTFFPGTRPAGNKSCVYQPSSCCFWLSARGAVVFIQTQGQSSVTNNTRQRSTLSPAAPSLAREQDRASRRAVPPGKDRQPWDVGTGGMSWPCVQSLSCARDRLRTMNEQLRTRHRGVMAPLGAQCQGSEVDTPSIGCAAASPPRDCPAGDSVSPSVKSNFLDFELCSVPKEDPNTSWLQQRWRAG